MNQPARQSGHWSEEDKETVRRLWVEGYSQKEIASHFGGRTTKYIIGRLARTLGLPARTPVTSSLAATLRHRANRKDAHPPRETIRNMNVPAGGPVAGVSFEEMTETKGCRWPLFGEFGEIRFCGCDREPGRSYCKTHLELSIDRAATAKAQAKDGVK